MLSAPMPRTSSSAIETETIGILSAVQARVLELLEERDVAVAVERVEHASGLAALILLTIVANSVSPSGGYSSPDDLHAVGLGRRP